MAIQFGDTFHWKEGGHLWVVISDPVKHRGEFVAVNLTKDVFRAGVDCQLEIGEHKWVTAKTYVNFGDAMQLGPKEEANLMKQVEVGAIKMQAPMSASVLGKIVATAKLTKSLAERLKKYL